MIFNVMDCSLDIVTHRIVSYYGHRNQQGQPGIRRSPTENVIWADCLKSKAMNIIRD